MKVPPSEPSEGWREERFDKTETWYIVWLLIVCLWIWCWMISFYENSVDVKKGKSEFCTIALWKNLSWTVVLLVLIATTTISICILHMIVIDETQKRMQKLIRQKEMDGGQCMQSKQRQNWCWGKEESTQNRWRLTTCRVRGEISRLSYRWFHASRHEFSPRNKQTKILIMWATFSISLEIYEIIFVSIFLLSKKKKAGGLIKKSTSKRRT